MKITNYRNKAMQIAIVFIAAAVFFSSLPVLTGFEANAAVSKPGKIYSINAKGIGTESAKVLWGKASGKVSGYAIYRNGKYVKSVGNKTFSYLDKKLKHSTRYKYTVRAFVYNGKYFTQYYNKKTKKWQNKAPAKKFIGKTRQAKVRLYGEASPVLSIKTEKPTIIHGKAFTPSMCPKSFIEESTKCKVCGKGKTIKVTYKNGTYDITITGTDRSEKCNHK